ncbi:hypothetical protein J6590_105490, partial [Homalodisca vitripennis]
FKHHLKPYCLQFAHLSTPFTYHSTHPLLDSPITRLTHLNSPITRLTHHLTYPSIDSR